MSNLNNNEQGLVLIVVILSIVILTILALGYTYLLTSELKRTEFDEKLVHSLPASEAGIDRAEWLFQTKGKILRDKILDISIGEEADSFSIPVGTDSSCTVSIRRGWE